MNYDPAHPDNDVEVDADAAMGHVHAVGFTSSSSEDDDVAAARALPPLADALSPAVWRAACGAQATQLGPLARSFVHGACRERCGNQN